MWAQGGVLNPRPSGELVGAEDLTESRLPPYSHTSDHRPMCVYSQGITNKEKSVTSAYMYTKTVSKHYIN